MKMVDKMFDSRRESRSCGESERLLGYLYDELNISETASFEAHLEGCPSCAEDLASFSSIRMSVAELPPLEVEQPVAVLSEWQKPGILAWIRDWFGRLFGSRGLTAAAAAAVLVVGALIAFNVFFGATEMNLIANVNTVPSPASKGTSLPPIPEAPEVVSQEDVQGQGDRLQDDDAGSLATSMNPKRIRKPARRPKERKTVPVDQLADTNEVPRLSEAAAEGNSDDSLRLTDLFSETGEK